MVLVLVLVVPELLDAVCARPDRLGQLADVLAGLARALASVMEAGVSIDGAADHGVSEAIYFRDPDGNGVEIYRDRAPEDWPRDATGELAMVNDPIDLQALLAEARLPA